MRVILDFYILICEETRCNTNMYINPVSYLMR